MKKLICAVLLTAVVTGCSAKEEKVPENGVKIKDIFVCIDENFNQVKNHLDEVLTVSAQASCIYPGDEKIYSYQDYEIQTYPDGANEKVESVTIRSSEYEASGNVQIGSDIRSLENEVSDTEIIKTPRIWFYEKENFGIRYFYDSDHKVNAIEVYKIVEGK